MTLKVKSIYKVGDLSASCGYKRPSGSPKKLIWILDFEIKKLSLVDPKREILSRPS